MSSGREVVSGRPSGVVPVPGQSLVGDGSIRLIEARQPPEPDEPLNLLQYWNLLVKHRWLLASMVTLGLLAGTLVTLFTKPVFQATATVQIDREPRKVVAVGSQRDQGDWSDRDTFYQTQYEILRSRALAHRVAANEKLGEDSEFLSQRKGASISAKRRKALSAAAGRTEVAAELVSENLEIEPVRLSRLVKVSYRSSDPDMAARVANAVVENYITWNLERRFDASSDARRFLEERLKQTREALEASQRRGNDYAQKNQLITLGDGGVGDGAVEPAAAGASLAASDLAMVNQQLASATSQRIAAEQRWRQAVSTPDMALPEMLSNPSAQTIKAARTAAWVDYEQNSRIFKPEWPAMADAKRKIDALDQQLAAQAASIRDSLRSEFLAAQKNEAQLRAKVEQGKRELLSDQAKRVEQGFINTDTSTSKSLYEGMLASYKEIGIAGAIGENNVSFVDKADAPVDPIKPQPAQILLRFGLLGLALGAMLALLRERLDNSIKLPEEVERTLGVALLGTIPLAPKETVVAEALEDPKTPISEAYHSLRTALQFSTEDGVPSSLLITSPGPAEGKSTSALAIASGFARLGMRVLLVDADMRDPSLHTLLSRDNSIGLSNLLAGGPEIRAVVQSTQFENLRFLPCGPLPPNPAELLGGGRMRVLLKACQTEYDLVVLDGAPVMGFSDSPQLANLAAGTVLIIEAGRTRRDFARAAIQRLRLSRGRLLGSVLTKFDAKKVGHAYGHSYGYGFGNGFEYGGKSSAKPEPASRLAARKWLTGKK